MDEVVLIDKPSGWTSFDVVGKIRSLLRQETGQKVKVGHAGTLDPLATGLLIVLLGRATKRQDEFMKLDKVYEVELKLGETTTTADAEGEKSFVTDAQPTEEQVKKVLESFLGTISQVPPAYSAIKIDGKRAYKLAREGKEVKIEPRHVTIYFINQVKYNYPHISFTTQVSSGTYIRSLAVDIGEKLGVGAYMSNLRRTSIGKFSIGDSLEVGALSYESLTKGLQVDSLSVKIPSTYDK